MLIRKQAKKSLQSLPGTDRHRIVEKITNLGKNPNNEALDINPLQGKPYFRLRAGQWRIIFSRDDEIKIIAIEKIKSRGDAYK